MDASKYTTSASYAIFVIAALFILGFIGYSNILYAPFVFDDINYIVNNHLLRNLQNLKDTSGTRYIGYLSFAINYYFGGLNTFGYHIVNIVIHILNSILVYFLVQITADRLKAICNGQSEKSKTYNLLPITCSLIFLVHPIQTQAVSYITQRFTSLAAFFYLLAIVLYIKYRLKTQGVVADLGLHNDTMPTKVGYYSLYVLSILSAIFAMKTKEISFTLPFIIILYEFTFFRNLHSRLKTRFLYLIPYVATLLIIPLNLFFKSTYVPLGSTAGPLADLTNLSKYNYLVTQFRVIVTYIRLLFLPVNQQFDYDYPIFKTFFDFQVFLSFLFLLSIFGLAIYLYMYSRKTMMSNRYGILSSFGIFWFFITLSVESSIIPIANVIFEHRLYLPSIGFIMAAVSGIFYGFECLEKRFEKSLVLYVLSLIGVITFTLLFATYNRNTIWKNEISLWEDEVKKSPLSAHNYNGLGYAYHVQGNLDEAIRQYLKALSLDSDLSITHYNLGVAYANKGWLDAAITEYLTAIRLKSDFFTAHYSLGNAYAKQGRLNEAINEYLTALKLKPDYQDARNNLEIIYKKWGWKRV